MFPRREHSSTSDLHASGNGLTSGQERKEKEKKEKSWLFFRRERLSSHAYVCMYVYVYSIPGNFFFIPVIPAIAKRTLCSS